MVFFAFSLIVYSIDNSMDQYFYLLYVPPAVFFFVRATLELIARK